MGHEGGLGSRGESSYLTILPAFIEGGRCSFCNTDFVEGSRVMVEQLTSPLRLDTI